MVIDRRNNYYVDEHSDNGNNNSYEKYIEVSRKYANIKRRCDNIYEELLWRAKEENTTKVYCR